MAWVALAAVAVSVLSQQKQAKQEEAAANYNAKQAEADAAANTAAAKVQAQKIRQQGAQQASQANASYAASGVETGQDTSLRVTSGIAGDAENDAYNTILNGVNTSNRYVSQAQGYRIAGQQARESANINSAATVLQGGGRYYNGWKRSSTTVGGA